MQHCLKSDQKDVTVVCVTRPEDLDAIRESMRSLDDWFFERHHEYVDWFRRYFDPEDFNEELKNLPGEFGPPNGVLLLTSVGNSYAGSVGLRDLGQGNGEMKCLLVDPTFHG